MLDAGQMEIAISILYANLTHQPSGDAFRHIDRRGATAILKLCSELVQKRVDKFVAPHTRPQVLADWEETKKSLVHAANERNRVVHALHGSLRGTGIIRVFGRPKGNPNGAKVGYNMAYADFDAISDDIHAAMTNLYSWEATYLRGPIGVMPPRPEQRS